MSCIKNVLRILLLSGICELSQVMCQIDNGHHVEGEPVPPSPPPIQIGRGTLSAAYLQRPLQPGQQFGESPGPERDEIGTRAGATGNAIGPVEVYLIRPTQGQARVVNACLCAQGNIPFLLVKTGANAYTRFDVPINDLHL